MSHKKPKAVRRRMISCFAQIINSQVLGYRIPELVKDEKIRARKLSYDSQIYLLMLGQFLHVFSLNELVDISKIYEKELSRVRNITAANLNTFSNANRTRNPEIMEKFFWMMYAYYRDQDEMFIRGRHHGKLAKFKLRGIYAIDSTTIKLAYWCIGWAKHRQKKAAVKVHMVANVASRLPHFCVYGKANEHDSKKEDILFEALKEGDIGILDRAYNNFATLYRQSQRGVIFVVREKEKMLHGVVESVPKAELGKNIIADETIRLTGLNTAEAYPAVLRRVTAHVEIDGKWRDLVFLTNNFDWAASTIAELYKARWQVELLFKELKQTLQLQDFFGENENAIQWQIWAALLTHLILRYLKYRSRAICSYSRFTAVIRAIVWLKKDLMEVLGAYGIAPPPKTDDGFTGMPYLPGFEKLFARAM